MKLTLIYTADEHKSRGSMDLEAIATNETHLTILLGEILTREEVRGMPSVRAIDECREHGQTHTILKDKDGDPFHIVLETMEADKIV